MYLITILECFDAIFINIEVLTTDNNSHMKYFNNSDKISECLHTLSNVGYLLILSR